MKNLIAIFYSMIIFATGCSLETYIPVPQIPESNTYILHAGGTTPDGITGSNSLEALNHSYDLGYRIMEIDFCWTEDNHLVCVHDWDAYYSHLVGRECVTIEEFEKMRYGTYGFTSMTLVDLIPWMKEHSDVIIVTDIKERSTEGAKLIAEKYPDMLNRFWFQIYDTDDYNIIKELGFTNIILTVYQMSWEEKQDAKSLVKFAQEHQLVGLTYPIELHNWIPDYTKTLLTANTPLFVHTVNDDKVQEELFSLGVSGIYMDN